MIFFKNQYVFSKYKDFLFSKMVAICRAVYYNKGGTFFGRLAL
jgi:hypothetical protein